MDDFATRVVASLMSADGIDVGVEGVDFSVFYSAEYNRGRFASALRCGEVAKGDEVLVGWFRDGEWVRADGVVVERPSEFLIPGEDDGSDG